MNTGYSTIDFEIEGAAPLLMHNGQLADPMNRFSKEMKKVTGRKKKTEADYTELARIEFLGSLYLGSAGEPVIPGEVLEATIISGAKVTKKGKVGKSALIVDGNFPLIYNGPKTTEGLLEDDNFRHVAGVKVGQARVMRTRPKFNQWKLKFTVHYLSSVLDAEEIVGFVEAAGQVAGLGDGRPRFGRFNVLSSSAGGSRKTLAAAA